MIGSYTVECSGCGRKINLQHDIENKDFTIEVHDGEECFFARDAIQNF